MILKISEIKEKFNNSKILLPILLFIILVILFIITKFIIINFISNKMLASNAVKLYDANKDTQFKISKIIRYSSADVTDNSEEQNLENINIHQYSDIAIYIDNISEELTEKNTIKSLYIDNFECNVEYGSGEHLLYYKNPTEISKFRMNDENKIADRLDYKIVYTNEENQNSNYNEPVFYSDCSNPITISFVNKNIVEGYEVSKRNNMISFDGRIFNNLDIDLEKLSPKIKFNINIENNLGEIYTCNVSAKMDLECETGTIKSGYIIQINNYSDQYKFLKNVI